MTESDRTTDGPLGSVRGWARRRRENRPVFGAGLLLISGSLLLLQVDSPLEGFIIPGSIPARFSVFASLLLVCAFTSFLLPRVAPYAGLLGSGFAVLSIVPTQRWTVVGGVIGIIGGLVCAFWYPPESDRGESCLNRLFEEHDSEPMARSKLHQLFEEHNATDRNATQPRATQSGEVTPDESDAEDDGWIFPSDDQTVRTDGPESLG